MNKKNNKNRFECFHSVGFFDLCIAIEKLNFVFLSDQLQSFKTPKKEIKLKKIKKETANPIIKKGRKQM